MSWMDDGGFEMQTFTAWDGRPMARMSFRTSTGLWLTVRFAPRD